MATGPEHYGEAERLIESAHNVSLSNPTESALMAQLALVHATLAHTAAVAEMDSQGTTETGRSAVATKAWRDAFNETT